MIRVRVVEAEQLASKLGCAPFGRAIVLRSHLETAPRPFFRHVRQRQRFGHHAVAADQGAAALVRIRFGAVSTNSRVHLRFQLQSHYRFRGPGRPAPPWSGDSSQNRSDRYFSPPSGKMTTITESGDRRATSSAATRFAPLEMPTNNPLRASWRVSSNASSVETPRSSAANISRAFRIAPSDPCIGSVNTISAPNALRIRLRSGVTLLGTHSLTR